MRKTTSADRQTKRGANRHRPRRVVLVFDPTSGGEAGLIRGIRRFAQDQHNLILRLVLHRFLTRERLRQWATDGLLVSGMPERLPFIPRGFPTVDTCHSAHSPFPYVGFDNAEAGRVAANFLLGKKLEHFAYFGCAAHSWNAARREGLRETLTRHGVTCRVYGGFPYKCLIKSRGWFARNERACRWLQALPKPVGVFAFNDVVAQHLIQFCSAMNIHVPQDVTVLGADNDQLTCELNDPPISSIALPFEQVGFEAARTLWEMLETGRKPPAAKSIPIPGVVDRKSADILIGAGPHLTNAVHYIRAHAHQPLSINEVLSEVPISRRALEYQCRRVLGLTPHQFLLRERIEHVKRLLTTTDWTASRIATQTGFRSAPRLSEVFRRLTKMTPSEYRRKFRSAN